MNSKSEKVQVPPDFVYHSEKKRPGTVLYRTGDRELTGAVKMKLHTNDFGYGGG